MPLLRHSGHALLMSKRRNFTQTQRKFGAIFFRSILIFLLAGSFAQAAKRKKPHVTLEFIYYSALRLKTDAMALLEDRPGPVWTANEIRSSGMLYYWIRATDLAEHRFDKVWMTLQCC